MEAITSLFRRFGLIASVLILTSGSDSQAQTNTVHIPDPELQSVIRATLNKPTGDITAADMESLTVLDASVNSRGAQRPAIASLEGLEAARSLRTLNLASFIHWMYSPDPAVLSTTNLATLSTLANLETLDLSYYYYYAPANPSLPSVLSNLTNLQSLTLEATPLANSSFLTNLIRLRSLNLGQTGLTNLPPLAGLTNLEALWLSDNSLENVSIPSGLGNLRELQLFQTGLQSLTLPDDLIQLQTLGLWNNQLTDISFVARLPNLRELDVWANKLNQVDWPDTSPRLKQLNVENNPLTNLTLPASIDLSAITLIGFPQNQVAIRGLWMRQPFLENDGQLRLRVSGAPGRTVHVQRTTNLVDWEPWQTVVLGQNGAELLDNPSSPAQRFFRVLGQ